MREPSESVRHAMDLLSDLGEVSARSMFGGTGIYCDGVMVALEAFDEIYLKTDDRTKGDFEAAGSEPFVYEGKGQPVTMSYYRVPDTAVDDRHEFLRFAALALGAARRARAGKRRR